MRKIKAIYELLLIGITFGCASSIRSLSDIKWTDKETSISNKIDNLGYYKIRPKQSEAFIFPDFGDTSPKRLYLPLFGFHSRTPLRELFQILDFPASPQITVQKVENSLFIGILRD